MKTRYSLILPLLICIVLCTNVTAVIAQSDTIKSLHFFEPSPVFDQKRFNYGMGGTVAMVTGFGIGLSTVWYSQYEQESFHLFNDWDEWQQMDKAGHIYTAYLQSHWWYKGSRWAGVSENNSILIGALAGTVFQASVEVLDGFSSEWGFSLGDIGANTVGVGAFVLQQRYWGEQRIQFKMSTYAKSYPDQIIRSQDGLQMISLDDRAKDLYGDSFTTSWLKDYNAQTIWASVNVHSFLPKGNKWPQWLNIAAGYSGENMYGGYDNIWTIDGSQFILDAEQYPRYRQFYIGLDLDLNRVNVKNHFLKSLFSFLNIFKVPSPAIEINTRGEVLFHFVQF